MHLDAWAILVIAIATRRLHDSEFPLAANALARGVLAYLALSGQRNQHFKGSIEKPGARCRAVVYIAMSASSTNGGSIGHRLKVRGHADLVNLGVCVCVREPKLSATWRRAIMPQRVWAQTQTATPNFKFIVQSGTFADTPRARTPRALPQPRPGPPTCPASLPLASLPPASLARRRGERASWSER